MRNFLKIKKRKIAIFLLLISNHFLFNAYSTNYRKIDLGEFDKNKHREKYNKVLNL